MKTDYKKNQFLEFNKSRFLALLDKNWKQFYRNINGVLFTLVFPIILIIIFFVTTGDITGVRIAIVNKENSNSRCSIANASIHSTIAENNIVKCYFENLDCKFNQYLQVPMFVTIPQNTLEDAIAGVKKGEWVGIIYTADNFTKAFENRFNAIENIDKEDIGPSQIQVYMDMSNREIGESVKYKLYDLFFKFQDELNIACNNVKNFGKSPVNIIDPAIYGSKDDSVRNNMIPGIFISLSFYMGSMLTSHIILSDRFEGIWERSMVSRISSVEITLSHLLLQGFIILILIWEMIATVIYILNFENNGSVWVIAVISFLEGLSGIIYGFLVSILADNYTMALNIVFGTFFPSLILCGLIWPVEAMPIVMRWIATCFPFPLPTTSIRNVMGKGWDFSYWQVSRGILVQIIWIIMLTLICFWILKSRKR